MATARYFSRLMKLNLQNNVREFSILSSTSKNADSTVLGARNVSGPTDVISRNLTSSLILKNDHVLSKNAKSSILKHPQPCSCCMHTQGDEELVKFLSEEIKEEQKIRKEIKKIDKIGDFAVTNDGSRVMLERTFGNEKILLTAEITHSVDSAGVPFEEEMKDNPEPSEMVSRPNFTVEITKPDGKLQFGCSYVSQNELENGLGTEESDDTDEFGINEISMYEKEMKENTYIVSGDILDGQLYDLLMNMLDERGVNSEVVSRLSDYCTTYEHGQYIGLLEKFKNFVSK